MGYMFSAAGETRAPSEIQIQTEEWTQIIKNITWSATTEPKAVTCVHLDQGRQLINGEFQPIIMMINQVIRSEKLNFIVKRKLYIYKNIS